MATITKRNNTYLIRVSCGFDGNNKRITKCLTWKPSLDMTEKQAEKEAGRQAVLFEEKCRTGQVLDGNMKLNDFIDIWLTSYAERELRPKTLDRYKSLLVRIKQALGHMKLDKIQPHHLNIFYDNLSEEGVREDIKYHSVIDLRQILKEKKITQSALSKLSAISENTVKSAINNNNIRCDVARKLCKALDIDINKAFVPDNDKPLSAQTRLHYHRLLSSILNTAVQWGVLFYNPCTRIKPPKIESKEPKYLDEEQAAKLFEAVENQDNYQYEVMVKLLVYAGMRRGELCALQWQDIDFNKSSLSINKSLLYTKSKGLYIDTTKNATSYRIVKLPLAVMLMLKDFKRWQNECKNKLGSKWIETDYLFTTWVGMPIHPNNFSKWFHKFIASNDLPDISVHSLRHTSATLQIAGGVSTVAVAKRLGHSSPITTNRVYAHAIRSADEMAAEVLDDILTPKLNIKAKKEAAR